MSLCAPWPLDESLPCCDLPDGTDPDLLEAWQEVASEILWAASGRRIGTCEETIRPCLRRCGGGSGLPVPYKGTDGAWRNIGCGCVEDCSCDALCEVILPGPVAEVTEVLIDGVTLAEDSWRVDKVRSGWRLLRTDGNCFPDCQDMTADCDQEGAFCVTYLRGTVPDALAIAAVTELACELTKACLPGCKTCRLPKNVTQVVRQGVTITYDNSKAWLNALPFVAAFLGAVNPLGLISASSVWSPDISTRRQSIPQGS